MELFTDNPGLFNSIDEEMKPLAERIRADDFTAYVGQEHITGKDSALQTYLKNRKIFSTILWGPPGSGKTTLAKIIAHKADADFFQINAVSSSVKELRAIITEAKYKVAGGRKVILFIDEIHRFNKAQQDALLSAVESGLITLIGATTENPSFEVNSALLSRCRVLVLKELNSESLKNILERSLSEDVVLRKYQLSLSEESKEILINAASGDARKMLNLLEISSETAIAEGKSEINREILKKCLNTAFTRYDKKGEQHYDIISAFIKSIRGSDPDAAVYYLARMLHAGEDPVFIARRLIILASEDIGNASPNGLVLANAGLDAIHKIGMPEARIVLSQVTTYLAAQPKSNAAYLAIDKALAEVEKSQDKPQVPLHLRNAPTKLMKSLGYGQKYKYAHDFKGNFADQQFLPDELKNEQYYLPTENGQELKLKERLNYLWGKSKIVKKKY